MNEIIYFIELNNSHYSFGLIKKKIRRKERESFTKEIIESEKGKGEGTETRMRIRR